MAHQHAAMGRLSYVVSEMERSVNFDGYGREIVVPLDEYRIKRFGHNSAVDNLCHHSGQRMYIRAT